ncbi:hypothetical protein B296_00021863 [Ensete ventricosum]|uniref:Myb/SANT-like DNA-binding domain-containing protein n=1 Tax=Ensete ventricosum TaxID=4639 RepID=A0A427AZ24_ENSVE|nr:hypothetical protein B296_00021863 [Ensete ventricosum]
MARRLWLHALRHGPPKSDLIRAMPFISSGQLDMTAVCSLSEIKTQPRPPPSPTGSWKTCDWNRWNARHAQYVPSFGHVRDKQQPSMSSEEEPRYGDEVDDQVRRGGMSQPSPSASPWQRMKWTDGMVRLLIQVVYRVGDDGGGAEGEQQQPQGSVAKGKKSSSAAAAASASALLQKKGKWKSVSRAMMEKGFFVSPQQCEDKFNDLNKRYKRVNDLLGKGTACRVVENQSLLETMDLSPTAKEEARKLLNSKHLFFREMCAYHNAGAYSACAAPPPPQMPPPHSSDQQQQQHCFHHPPGRADTALSTRKAAAGGSRAAVVADEEGMAEEMDDDDDDDVDSEDDDEYDDEDDDEDDDMEYHNHKRQGHHQHKHEEVGEDEDTKKHKKTASQASASPPLSLTLSSPSSSAQQLRSEMVVMSGGGEQQQRQWLKRKATELEEQRVAYQCRAFQLERQRFKWLRFSTNKEREMERMKLENERLRLENDRMALLLRQRELELIQGGGGGGVSSAEQQLMLQNTNANPNSATTV